MPTSKRIAPTKTRKAVLQNPEAAPQRYDAWFRFLTFADDDCQGKGTVLIDGDKMKLEIPAPDFVPNTTLGRKCHDWFKGENILSNDSPVKAKWAFLGDMYVGTWIEDGIEYLFSFQILES